MIEEKSTTIDIENQNVIIKKIILEHMLRNYFILEINYTLTHFYLIIDSLFIT